LDLFVLYRFLLPIAGLCLVGMLVAAWGRRHNQRVNGPVFLAPLLQAVTWLGLLFMALDLGWLGGYWLAEVERPIHITTPFNDQMVSLRQQVMGSYKEIPAGQTLWVVVAPYSSSLYFPQQSPAVIQPNGTWSSLTFIGSPVDAGHAFDIFLVLVNQKGQQVFVTYLAGQTQNGLSSLPPGATIVDKVTIWRK
jgi:hypothetical protein